MSRKPRIENRSRILRSIWISSRISRVQIARDLDLNKSTITDIVSELIEQGIIIETAEGAAGQLGGRKPIHLEFNKQYGYVLGLELRTESYSIVAVSLSGEILFTETVDEVNTQKTFQDRIVYILNSYREELKWIGAPVLGAGVGMSGIIDSKDGIINGSIALKVSDKFDFQGNISDTFDFPVFVENDANCCAWGELAFNRSEKLKNFIFTLVEFHPSVNKEVYENTSVGFGMVFNGNVYFGNGHSAGEFHSIYCAPEDKGQFKITSQNSVIEESPILLENFTRELSKHLALFINTFNLSQIFLGGDIEKHQDIVLPILTEEIERNWMYKTAVNCDIRFSSQGNKSVAYGAAGMVLERLFNIPEWKNS